MGGMVEPEYKNRPDFIITLIVFNSYKFFFIITPIGKKF